MSVERVGLDSWNESHGHIKRYQYAASKIEPGSSVNDIACGIGYGSKFLPGTDYWGYDAPGVPDLSFPGTFIGVDLNDGRWEPRTSDVTICFETLEHVTDPLKLASVIAINTRSIIFVSVPVVPTKHINEFHLHDFTEDDIPPMFSGFDIEEDWAQPSELSHVWMLKRNSSV